MSELTIYDTESFVTCSLKTCAYLDSAAKTEAVNDFIKEQATEEAQKLLDFIKRHGSSLFYDALIEQAVRRKLLKEV